LGRRVGDAVSGAGAAALEDVVETHPVADLVGGCASEVVSVEGATWGGTVQDVAAVLAKRIFFPDI
jgi:hypothetical protein